jgi:hypothetical protein
LLCNGEVLVAGGSNNLKDIDSAELYDPVSGTRTATAASSLHAVIIRRRYFPTAWYSS